MNTVPMRLVLDVERNGERRLNSIHCEWPGCGFWLDCVAWSHGYAIERAEEHRKAHQTAFKYHRPTLRELLEGRR